MLTAIDAENNIIKFIIGKAPEVCDPGCLTLMIDDFCVRDKTMWYYDTGVKLTRVIKQEAHAKEAVQILIVCGAHYIANR